MGEKTTLFHQKHTWLSKLIKPYEVCSCLHLYSKVTLGSVIYELNVHEGLLAALLKPLHFSWSALHLWVCSQASNSGVAFFLVNLEYTGISLWTTTNWIHKNKSYHIQHRFALAVTFMCQTLAQMTAYRYNI